MILNALALTPKIEARDDFRSRHFKAEMTVQVIS